jgi:hypothetical protein
MNTHRVTLTAFGTTGVLLAASLTMLAIVSALVTFDAWPTRDRTATAAQIAVENPHAARVVRAVRRAGATTGAGAGLTGGGAAGGGPGAGIPGGNPPGGGNPGNPTTGRRPDDPSPSPHVGASPPGEDPNPGGGPGVVPSDGTLIDRVTAAASEASPVDVQLPPPDVSSDLPALP